MSTPRFDSSWILLGREPTSEEELLYIYVALLGHAMDIGAKRLSLMAPGSDGQRAYGRSATAGGAGTFTARQCRAAVKFFRRPIHLRLTGEIPGTAPPMP